VLSPGGGGRAVDPATGQEIRDLRPEDLDAVMEIEVQAFSTPWRRITFAGLLAREDADLLALTERGRLVGYAVCWTVVDQAELGNVAVAPDQRGRGAGRRLVEAALERVRRRGARECFLEVRESNASAQALYRRLGFEVVGRRRRYYDSPVEDALVMRVELR
jgi:ribosomal-protein-alanine N-acetyltransferase